LLRQRQFKTPAKKSAKPEHQDEERPPHPQPDMERYQLQIDRQTKRSFKTLEAAQSAALEVKTRFPALTRSGAPATPVS